MELQRTNKYIIYFDVWLAQYQFCSKENVQAVTKLVVCALMASCEGVLSLFLGRETSR